MCCSGAKWKREEVPDHKFDFVDTREFTDNGFVMRMKYLFLYAVVLKSFLVYMSDIFTATTMISTNQWSNQIYAKCKDQQGCIFIDFMTAKWIFFGCILFGFLLLAYESHKAKKIIASRDISFAFTNVMANNYYSLRSYDHFCFFDHIKDSATLSDDFAFFIFFTFKSWKRLILSDGPRQTINGFTVYALYLAKKDYPCQASDILNNTCRPLPWYDVSKYFSNNNISTSALLISTIFTLVVFVVSLLILIVAAVCYIPLLLHIRGNLKEYCCHKVDKRIDEIIKRRQKQRLVEAARLAKKEAMGDFSHLKNKKGELVGKRMPEPTLPNVSLEDETSDISSANTRFPPYTQDNQYYASDNYPPPMPSYTPYPHGHDQYPGFNPSVPTLTNHDGYDPSIYGEETESTANLAAAAAPFGYQSNPHYPPSAYPNEDYPIDGGHIYDPRNAYQTHAGHVLEASRRTPNPPGPPSGIAYGNEDGADYPPPQDFHSAGTIAYEYDGSADYPPPQDFHVGHQHQPTAYYPPQGRGYDMENGRGYQGGYDSGYAM